MQVLENEQMGKIQKITLPIFNQAGDAAVEKMVQDIRDHARNLYESREYLCTEAVLLSLNNALDGGLTERQAVSMASPFCIGMGNSGCLCGALSGAVLAAGLLTGWDKTYSRRKEMRRQSKMLHDNFRMIHGATCCRVLSKNVKNDKKAHFRQCAELTANSAEMAARLVLSENPVVKSIKFGKILKKYNRITGLPLRIRNWLFH